MANAPQADPQRFRQGDQSTGVLACIGRTRLDYILNGMRIFNILNAALLMASCVFGFAGYSAGNVTRFFLTLYIGVFAILLGLFELRVKWTAPFIRKLFGFMFTYWGRTIFLIFCGALNFGVLGDDTEGTLAGDLAISAGVITIANAIFSCVVLCSHPAFRGDSQAAERPDELSEAQVQLYLAQHPELMHSAVQGMTTEQTLQGGSQKSDFGAGANTGPAATGQSGGGYTPPPVPVRSSATAANDDNPFGGENSSEFAAKITAAPPAPPVRSSAPAPAPTPAPAPASEANPFEADDNPFA